MATETVRFSRVVEEAGQPESYTLWMKPEQDKAFAALLRRDRVMTVHQGTAGAKADYGMVGYTEDRHQSLLVFPKSLKAFAGKRIIGIKYDELKGVSSAEREIATPRPKTSPPKKEASVPKPKKEVAPSPPKKEPVARPKKKEAVPPPANQIPFPKPEIVRLEKSEKVEERTEETSQDPAEEVALLRKVMKKALDALAKDKPVAAFNLLKDAMQEEGRK